MLKGNADLVKRARALAAENCSNPTPEGNAAVDAAYDAAIGHALGELIADGMPRESLERVLGLHDFMSPEEIQRLLRACAEPQPGS
jgi:hypothetical protein